MTPETSEEGLAIGWKLGFPEIVLFVVIVGLLVFQLLVPPIVGLADNGDYARVLGPSGLESTAEGYADRYWRYVNREYLAVPRSARPFMLSSDLLLVESVKRLERLVTGDEELDLIVMGAARLVAYVLGIYLILLATRTSSVPARAVIGFAVLGMGTDVAYVAVLNSFYQEATALVFLTILIGLVLLAIRNDRPWCWLLVWLFAGATLFVGAKAQYYPLVLPLLLVPLAMLKRANLRPQRALVITMSVMLLAVVGFLYARVPPTLRAVNLWHALFMNILVHSAAPDKDLEEFGLDPSLVRFVGKGAYAQGVPVHQVIRRYDFGDVGRFYLRHPGRLIEIGGRVAGRAFDHRDPGYGNFTKASGKPPLTLSRSLVGWSKLESRLIPSSLSFLSLFFGTFFLFGGWELWRTGLSSRRGLTVVFCLVVAVMAVGQFFVVVAVEGEVDVIKHLYMFRLLFDVCLIAVAVWAIDKLAVILNQRRWRGPAPAGEED